MQCSIVALIFYVSKIFLHELCGVEARTEDSHIQTMCPARCIFFKCLSWRVIHNLENYNRQDYNSRMHLSIEVVLASE